MTDYKVDASNSQIDASPNQSPRHEADSTTLKPEQVEQNIDALRELMTRKLDLSSHNTKTYLPVTGSDLAAVSHLPEQREETPAHTTPGTQITSAVPQETVAPPPIGKDLI